MSCDAQQGAPSRNSATPSPAPEPTPNTWGPASGLRKRFAFQTAGEPPAKSAVTLFNRMMSRTAMSLVAGSQAPPVRAAQTSPGGTATDPNEVGDENPQ